VIALVPSEVTSLTDRVALGIADPPMIYIAKCWIELLSVSRRKSSVWTA